MKAKRKVGVFKNKIVLFMSIALNKLVIEGNFLSLIKTIYRKPTVNITLNGEKLEASSLRSRTREDFLSPLQYNIVLKVPVTTKIHETEIKGILFGKKIKLS